MRALLCEEYEMVAGGTEVCEELAESIQTTATLDGILAGAATATLLPGGGPLIGGVIAAASIITGSILASEVEEACENHIEQTTSDN